MSLRRKIFYLFTAMVIAVFLVLPATGWLARLQLLPIVSSSTAGLNYITAVSQNKTTAIDAAFHRVAVAHPADFKLQYGYALQKSGEEGIQRLDALSQRFPNDPRILAAELRLASSSMHIGRDAEIAVLSPPSKQKEVKPSYEAVPVTPAKLARFDALAASGERLDPNNAYFPLMRAVGYFLAHRDTEAIAAWKRASEKTEWDNYTEEEMQSKIELLRAVNGGNEVSSYVRMFSCAVILLPDLGPTRVAAELATVKAIDAEVAGNTEEGFAIRHATRCIGETMRKQCKTYIGNRVGIVIASFASTRPGGAPAIEIPSDSTDDNHLSFVERDKRYQPGYDAYTSYLKRIGHEDEAEAFLATHNAGLQLKDLEKAGMQASYFGFNTPTYRLAGYWCGDAILITGALFALAFGGIFGLVYRFSPRLQKGEPLQASARWGVTSGILLPFIVLNAADNASTIPHYITIGGALILLIAWIAPPIMMRLSGKQIGHGLLVLLATLGSIAILRSVSTLTSTLFSSLDSLSLLGSGDDMSKASPENILNAATPVIIGCVMTLLPLLMLLAFALFSRILKIPVAAGVTRGMRAMSIPLACLLMLGWALCLIPTLHHETAAIAEIDRWATIGEAQNYVQLLGKPFPVPSK